MAMETKVQGRSKRGRPNVVGGMISKRMSMSMSHVNVKSRPPNIPGTIDGVAVSR